MQTMKRRRQMRIEETLEREPFTDRSTMIRLYPGDENRYSFPARKNWLYQLAMEVTMRNPLTRITRHFGKSTGQGARGDFCCSRTWDHFDFSPMYHQAENHAFARCAGEESDYDPDSWGEWRLTKVHAIYVILYRRIMQRKPGVRHIPKPVQFKEKKDRKPKTTVKQKIAAQKKEQALEKKYPTPKKYLNAQKSLRRKIASQKSRGLKRKKNK